jgi:hypothetical protein
VPLREAEVELVLSTRGREHVTALRRALDARGYRATLPDAEPTPRL